MKETPFRKHIPALDGVRAIAVLIVICFHFCQGFSHEANAFVGKIAVWGQTGVDLFFVLSGFLITGILLDSKGSAHFLRNFYVRRILRIFPLYYITLLSLYLVLPILHLNQWTPFSHSVWFWFYMQNVPATFAPELASGPNHFWSLAVEEHYYLVWPFIIMLLNRNRLFKAIGLAVAISLLTRVIFIHYATFYFTLARLDGLAIGSGIAVAARTQGLSRLCSRTRLLLAILGPVLVLAQILAGGEGLPVIQIVKSTLIASVYACVIILIIENQCGWMVTKLLSGRILGSVGKYSYGMYVLHPFILSWLGAAGVSFGLFGLSISILTTYLAAWISWSFFERPFLGLKKHFEYDSIEESISAFAVAES